MKEKRNFVCTCCNFRLSEDLRNKVYNTNSLFSQHKNLIKLNKYIKYSF